MKVSKHFWPSQRRPHTRHTTHDRTGGHDITTPQQGLKGFRAIWPGVIRRGVIGKERSGRVNL